MRPLTKILLAFAILGGVCSVFLFADFASAATSVGGSYSTDQHWTLSGSPYVVQSDFSTPPFGVGISTGATLTIDPGVIVKFKSGAQLWVDGAVIAHGTETEPIVFTSFYDDSIGGDTDGLGPTSGSSGDWWRIGGSNPGLEFDHALIRYSGLGFDLVLVTSPIAVTNTTIENGGYGFRLNQTGSLIIENNIIRDNGYGFWFDNINSSSNFIKNNLISGNSFRGAYNQTPDIPADMRNNSWGDPSGPFHPTLNPDGLGNQVSDGIIFDPWLEKPPAPRNPLIIIPGVYGAELWNGGELIWADLGRMFTDINDQFLTENLGLDGEGNSNQLLDLGDIIRSIGIPNTSFTEHIFDRLIENIIASGYQENQNLFVFPYDWRLNLDQTTSLLEQKIRAVKLITGATKVDLITHSMGGLLAKDYLNQYGNGSIDKLIFVGTPHLGAPKAAKVILFGDRIGIPWLEEDRIQELAHNSISAYELLPIQKYFDQFTGYIKKYGSSEPLPDYTQTKDFLLNEKGFNSTVFAKTEEFFGKHLEDYDLSGTDAYNIAGCKKATEAGYQLDNGNSSVSKTKKTSGDGTVPLPSADYINVPADNKFYVKSADHAELPSTNGVRELILGILNGAVTLADNVSRNQDFCNFRGKDLLWRSPVAVHIYDAFGNHSGPIENNGIEYGISGIDYDIIGEEKFIFLPTDEGQTYQIVAEGQADSTFDLLISENTDGEISTTNVFNDVAITPQTMVDFGITDADAPTSIRIDLLGDGNSQTVPASSQLTGEQNQDVMPPQTQADISGPVGLNGWHIGPVTVSLAATDDNSGILETRYSLDGGLTYFIYSAPITIADDNVADIRFYSVDNAGNNEEVKTAEIKIDLTPPEVDARFDTGLNNFVFLAIDNLDPNPAISCGKSGCLATDHAGHETIVAFKKSKVAGGKSLSFKTADYNGVNAILPDNILTVHFSKTRGRIRVFDQSARIEQKEVLKISYDPQGNESLITELQEDGSFLTYTKPGIKFLQVSTDEGKIEAGVK